MLVQGVVVVAAHAFRSSIDESMHRRGSDLVDVGASPQTVGGTMRLVRSAVFGSVVAVTSPCFFALSAEAATTSNGCTVSPVRPFATGVDANGRSIVRFSVSVTCAEGRTVRVFSAPYEEDS